MEVEQKTFGGSTSASSVHLPYLSARKKHYSPVLYFYVEESVVSKKRRNIKLCI